MIETKVKTATIASYFGMAAVLGFLNALSSTGLTGLPGWLETVLTPVLPALITFAAGYLARHTPRRPQRDVG